MTAAKEKNKTWRRERTWNKKKTQRASHGKKKGPNYDERMLYKYKKTTKVDIKMHVYICTDERNKIQRGGEKSCTVHQTRCDSVLPVEIYNFFSFFCNDDDDDDDNDSIKELRARKTIETNVETICARETSLVCSNAIARYINTVQRPDYNTVNSSF